MKKILFVILISFLCLFPVVAKAHAQVFYDPYQGGYYYYTPPPPAIPAAPKSNATWNFTANDDGTYDVLFKWTDDQTRRYSLSINKYQWVDPGQNPDTTIPTWTFHHVAPGTWYVNMKFEVNGMWSQVIAWKVDVPEWVAPTPTDTPTPTPAPFLNTQKSGGEIILVLPLIGGLALILIVSLVSKYKEKLKSGVVMKGILFTGIGIAILFFLFPKNLGNSVCSRTSPYPMPPEFQRAMSLRDQRLIENGTVFSKRDIKNCLDIQYSDLSNNSGAEGFFLFDPASSTEDLRIFVDNSYHGYDDILTAILLSHEMTHVNQFVNLKTTGQQLSCVDKEVEAFENELSFILSLNQEEKKSLFDRVGNNPGANSAYSGVNQLSQIYLNAQNNCGVIPNYISRDSNEFKKDSQCYWDSAKSQLQTIVEQNPFYQRECSIDTQPSP